MSQKQKINQWMSEASVSSKSPSLTGEQRSKTVRCSTSRSFTSNLTPGSGGKPYWIGQRIRHRIDLMKSFLQQSQNKSGSVSFALIRNEQVSTEHHDIGVVGFLLGYSEYPRKKVVEYLESHADAKLTPTLATEFPDLIKVYGVYDLMCSACGETYRWDETEWQAGSDDPALCSVCIEQGVPASLRSPVPADQRNSGTRDCGDEKDD
jgi:hypothetical protein